MREEVAGGWRRLHDEELRNLNASLNVVRVIKAWRMRWVGAWDRWKFTQSFDRKTRMEETTQKA